MDQIYISEGLLYFDDFPAGEKWKNIYILYLMKELYMISVTFSEVN